MICIGNLFEKYLSKHADSYNVPEPVREETIEPTVSDNMIRWMKAYFTLDRMMEIAGSESDKTAYQMGILRGVQIVIQTLENVHWEQTSGNFLRGK